MAITPSAQWLALARQNHSPLVVVALYLWNGASVDTYYFTSAPWLCGGVVNPCVVQIDGIGRSQDVKTREVSIDQLSLTCILDKQWESLVENYGIKGTQIRAWYGMPEITTTGDMLALWGGVVAEVDANVEERLITLVCKPLESKIRSTDVIGGWAACHPLQVAERICRYCGLDDNEIDTTALSPATHTDISHWVVTRHTTIGGQQHGGGSVTSAVKGDQLMSQLAVILDGQLATDEEGKFGYFPYDDTASPSANWTDDDLEEVEVVSLYGDLANRVSVNSHPSSDSPKLAGPLAGVLTARFEPRGGYSEDDEASQERFGWADPTGDQILRNIASWSLDLQFCPGEARLSGTSWDDGTGYPSSGTPLPTDTFAVAGRSSFAMAGARVAQRTSLTEAQWEAGTGYSQYPDTAQPSDAQLSDSRIAHLLIDDEIVTVDRATFPGPDFYTAYDCEAWLVPVPQSVTDRYPSFIEYRLLARGQLGTDKQAHDADGKNTASVLDITIAVAMVKSRIERWANGGTRLRVTTRSLEWLKLQLGDLVTITTDRFLSYGHNGLTTATKWEVASKTPHIFGDNPHVEFELVYATETSPPTPSVVGYANSVRLLTERERAYLSGGGEYAATNFVEQGFDFTDDGGLVGTLGTGSASGWSIIAMLNTPVPITFTASKDNYVTIDVASGHIRLYPVTISAGVPSDLPPTDVVLWCITTDGSDITGTEDLRPTRSIRGQKVLDGTVGDHAVAQTPGVLNANPFFDVQTDDERPPDGWEISDTDNATWDTDVKLSTSVTESGTNSLWFEDTTPSSDPVVQSTRKIPLRDYQLYRLSTTVRASSASAGNYVRAYAVVEYSGGDSTEYAINDELDSSGAWYTHETYFWGTTAPKCQLFASKKNSAFNAYFDQLRLEEVMPEFALDTLTLGGSQLEDTWTKLTGTEIYDHGSLVSSSRLTTDSRGTTYWFFEARYGIDTSDGNTRLALYKNGSLEVVLDERTPPIINGAEQDDYYVSGTAFMALADGDYIELYVYCDDDYDDSSTMTKTYFRGRQVGGE